MSKTIKIDAETIKQALQSSKLTSLTGLWKSLGGSGSVSGSASKKMREAVPGIEKTLAENKGKTAKAEGSVETTAGKRLPKTDKKPAKATKKSAVPRNLKNPFREGSGYSLLVDLLANAGSKGIGKPDLIKAYAKATGKDEQHCKYDLAVILSASSDSERKHRSCRDGFVLNRTNDHLSIRFD
jgi:hypothetical protein